MPLPRLIIVVCILLMNEVFLIGLSILCQLNQELKWLLQIGTGTCYGI